MIAVRARVPVYCVALLLGCSRYSEELREWQASDHDHTSEPSSAQGARAQASPAPSAERAEAAMALAEHGIDEGTLSTWTRECASCHGVIGRGDGPRAAMTGAKDLSRPDWHASVTDAAIAEVIRQGRNQMPPFALPAPTVDGLVRLVRLMDRSRAERVSPSGSVSAVSSNVPPTPAASSASAKSAPAASAARPAR